MLRCCGAAFRGRALPSEGGVLPAAKASESTSSAVHRTPDLRTRPLALAALASQHSTHRRRSDSVTGRSRRAVRCWRSVSCRSKRARERETEEPARLRYSPLRLGLLQRACRRASFLPNNPKKSGTFSGLGPLECASRSLMFFF